MWGSLWGGGIYRLWMADSEKWLADRLRQNWFKNSKRNNKEEDWEQEDNRERDFFEVLWSRDEKRGKKKTGGWRRKPEIPLTPSDTDSNILKRGSHYWCVSMPTNLLHFGNTPRKKHVCHLLVPSDGVMFTVSVWTPPSWHPESHFSEIFEFFVI